jgi:hypothetical protein
MRSVSMQRFREDYGRHHQRQEDSGGERRLASLPILLAKKVLGLADFKFRLRLSDCVFWFSAHDFSTSLRMPNRAIPPLCRC